MMDPLKHEHLLAMLKGKDAANRRRHADWDAWAKDQRFLRQAWMMAGLAQACLEENDLADTKAYMQDIWRFLLDEWISCIPKDEDIESSAGLLLDAMYSPDKWSVEQNERLQAHTDVPMLIDTFVHLASANSFNVKFFEHICHLLGYTWDQIYQDFASDYLLPGDAP